MTCLQLPGRTLLLVAGMPGAGKSTLLASLPPRPGTLVLDSDTFRGAFRRVLLPYPVLRPLIHLLHRLAVLRAACSAAPNVVVHLPATGSATRFAVTRLARATGRVPHLLWIDVDPVAARRGQRLRGRVVPEASFDGHAARAAATSAELRAGRLDGWATVTLLDRAVARTGLCLHTGRATRVRGPAVASSRAG